MQLNDWLKKEERTKVWLANKMGVQYHKVVHLCNGIGADAETIMKVANVTNGEVNINDWVKLEKARKK